MTSPLVDIQPSSDAANIGQALPPNFSLFADKPLLALDAGDVGKRHTGDSEADSVCKIHGLLGQARVFAFRARAEKLIDMVSAATQQLLDSPEEWSQTKRVPASEQDRDEITLLFHTLKSETYSMRRYAVSQMRECVREQYTQAQEETTAAHISDKYQAKRAIYASSKARNMLSEVRASVLIAERLFVALVFMELTVSALDHLAYGETFCTNASSEFALEHDNAMYYASLYKTYLTEDQRAQMQHVQAALRRPSDHTEEQLRELRDEYEHLGRLATPEHTPLQESMNDEDASEAKRIEEGMRRMHLQWADRRFGTIASEDYWKFNFALHKRLGEERIGLANALSTMLIAPLPGAKRALLDKFWAPTVLGKQKDSSPWYQSDPPGADRLIEANQHATGTRLIELLRQSGRSAMLWKPDLIEECKPHYVA